MVKDEYFQGNSVSEIGAVKSPIPQELGFQILDMDNAHLSPSVTPDQSAPPDRVLRMFDQKPRRHLQNTISIDQEEEIWADLERRIHS